jgi:membrane associated rhomboid family serine protease
MVNTSNDTENPDNLLSKTRKGALGKGQKMKSQRKAQLDRDQDYVLPTSESDDTGVESQGSSWTFNSVGTGQWTAVTMGTNYTTDSAYLETILRGDDLNYVKQKYGNMSIVISVIQLFALTMLIALCGVAPLNINPSIGPYPDALSLIGGTNSFGMFRQFQIWRFFTTPFLSAGALHFLCVIGIQLEIGAFFEREWGSKQWLTIYAISSVGSTFFDCAINTDGVSVGR